MKKKQAACIRCRKGHRKCELIAKEKSCARCLKAKTACIWDSQTNDDHNDPSPISNKRASSAVQTKDEYLSEGSKHQKVTSLVNDEHIYAKILDKSRISSQFVTSTQPLAPILSRDSLLCLDGEILGLFSPWRDIHYESRDQCGNKIDKELQNYLNRKGAFIVPQISEQRKLIQLYLNNLYPLYPVVQRNVLDKLSEVPLMLLNAMMLVGVRYDPTLKEKEFRVRAEEFASRCSLLEMIETNKVTLLQSYLLMSSNEEGPEGPSISRGYISKAVILTLELGLQVLSASEQFDMLKVIDESDKEEAFKLNYNKSLMVRLFWTSFCCDRTTAATSCTAMLYNTNDMIIEEPSLKDFDAGEWQEIDYNLFKRWLGLTKLFERVLMKVYRPPGKRSVDDTTLETDLLNWDNVNLINLPIEVSSKFNRFFNTVHAYCNLLYLRCKIGFLDFIEDTSSPPNATDTNNSLPLTTAGIYFVTKFSKEVITNLSYADNIEHIINSHVLLHVLVLIHLEIESKKQIHEETGPYSNQISNYESVIKLKGKQFEECLNLLKESKKKWWFSAAAYHLFNTLTAKQSTSMRFSPSALDSIFLSQGQLNPEPFNNGELMQ